MHNRIGYNRLGRKSSHRKSLHRNMVTSLIKHERIETTKAKAREIRRTAEKLVTRAKIDSVHNRRIVSKTVQEKDALNRLFTEVAPRFVERPGGYTRILKTGYRKNDAAEMVILEFLREDEEIKTSTPKKKTSAKKPAAKKPAAKKEKVPAETATAKTEVAETEVAETETPADSADDNILEAESDAKDKTVADEKVEESAEESPVVEAKSAKKEEAAADEKGDSENEKEETKPAE